MERECLWVGHILWFFAMCSVGIVCACVLHLIWWASESSLVNDILFLCKFQQQQTKKKKETITDNSHISDEYLFVSHMWGAVFDSFARTQTKYTGWQLNIHPFQKRNIMKRERKKNNQKERLWQLIDQNRNIFCKYQIHLWLFILQIFSIKCWEKKNVHINRMRYG